MVGTVIAVWWWRRLSLSRNPRKDCSADGLPGGRASYPDKQCLKHRIKEKRGNHISESGDPPVARHEPKNSRIFRSISSLGAPHRRRLSAITARAGDQRTNAVAENPAETPIGNKPLGFALKNVNPVHAMIQERGISGRNGAALRDRFLSRQRQHGRPDRLPAL